MKHRNSNLGWYLFLNVLVSAATTLGVLYAWDRLRPNQLPEGAQSILAAEQATRSAATSAAGGSDWQPVPSTTPLDPLATAQPLETVIEVGGVIGPGDVEQEFVLLKRVGESDLNLAGWKLQNASGESYEFPDLVLYKGGAVQVYSGPGADTATTLYWNRSNAAWKVGDVATLVDAQGNTRASYTIP